MHFAFTQDQRLIREAIADVVGECTTVDHARHGANDDFDPVLWQRLAETGMLGVLVDTEQDGSGLGLVEVGCVLEVLGSALASGPYLPSSVVAASVLRGLPESVGLARLPAEIALGRRIVCPLLPVGPAGATIERRAGRATISGAFAPVLYGAQADLFLLAAHDAGRAEPTVLLLPCNVAGVDASDIATPDRSRRLACVRLDRVEVAAAQELPSAGPALAAAPRVAAAALAAEMLGGASRVLDLACDYARERQQFGQPIGRFQAIKHLLADDKVHLEGLRSLVYAALWHLDHTTPEAAALVAAAKACASDVCVRIASDAIQVFGAMGIAAESVPHLYLKRAQVDRSLFGSTSHHYAALAADLAGARANQESAAAQPSSTGGDRS
jgi:alkylation response protein AidB-like acyl-CoA dehydrogenase